MRLSDLRDKPLRTLDGERLGRVHEVHSDKGRVTALIAGPGSFIERLTARNNGRRIPWEFVKRVEAEVIIVAADPPQRASARTRRSASRKQPRPKQRRN